MSDVEALLEHASQARREHRPADAQRDLAEALRLCRTSGTPMQLAATLTSLGQIERDLGHVLPSLEHYQEAAELYRAAGNTLKYAHTIRHLADIHLDEGRHDLAEPFYHEALALYRSEATAQPLDLANAIRGLALLKHATNERDASITLWEEALSLYTQVGVAAGVAESSRRLALLRSAQAR
ncbi:MAG TPA: tetratricopeptide repeat protein [Candidatus Angelobacter sp.]|nr:tetratricopeptide repeat protein [Candidatus Angelobacter sp.]